MSVESLLPFLNLLRINIERLISVNQINIGNTVNCNIIFMPPAHGEKRTSRATLLLYPDQANSDGSVKEHQETAHTLVTEIGPGKAPVDGQKIPPLRTSALTAGLYLRFVDLEWWKTGLTPYIDIAPNLRILSLPGQSGCFPSLEAEGRRLITIKSNHQSLVIEQEHRSMKFSINQIPRKPCKCQTGQNQYWSLRYIHPGRITKLRLNSTDVLIQYAKGFASSVWSLVNHHPRRGDEAYLILDKSGFGEKK